MPSKTQKTSSKTKPFRLSHYEQTSIQGSRDIVSFAGYRRGPYGHGYRRKILTQILIGNSKRLVRLAPTSPCSGNCIRVTQLLMRGKFVQDPNDPGHCSPGDNAYNQVSAKLTVTDENGLPLSGVRINGGFLDDYWTDRKVSGTTNAQGIVQISNIGPCGVGAVAFFVENAKLGTRTFDRTTGILTNFVIPQ